MNLDPQSVTNLPRDAREVGRLNMASTLSRSRRWFLARFVAWAYALCGGLVIAALMLGVVYAAIIVGGGR